jgi:catechol 2,3-dioxygenase-like lactoylglutathione lyase family enzyme
MFKSANVTVMVANFDRAVQFYTQTLGLKLKNRYEDQFAEIEAPGLTIGLHPSTERGSGPERSESLSIGLGVDNLDLMMSELRKKGVEFSSQITDGMLRIAHFKDPDGNPLYLAQIPNWQ